MFKVRVAEDDFLFVGVGTKSLTLQEAKLQAETLSTVPLIWLDQPMLLTTKQFDSHYVTVACGYQMVGSLGDLVISSDTTPQQFADDDELSPDYIIIDLEQSTDQ